MISKRTVQGAVKQSKLFQVSDWIVPKLPRENKIERLRFCMSFVDRSISVIPFQNLMNRVHTDEKWFFIFEIEAKNSLLGD